MNCTLQELLPNILYIFLSDVNTLKVLQLLNKMINLETFINRHVLALHIYTIISVNIQGILKDSLNRDDCSGDQW